MDDDDNDDSYNDDDTHSFLPWPCKAQLPTKCLVLY